MSTGTTVRVGLSTGPYGDLGALRSDLAVYYGGLAAVASAEESSSVLDGSLHACAARARIDDVLRASGTVEDLAGALTRQGFAADEESFLIQHVVPSLGDTSDGTTLGSTLGATETLLLAHLEQLDISQEMSTWIRQVVGFAPFHVDLRGPRESSYDHATPGVIQLNMGLLGGHPAHMVEAILHESLHAVFYGLSNVRGLFPRGYVHGAGEVALIPWGLRNGKHRTMDAYRCLMTLHVYAHVSAYYADLLRMSNTNSAQKYQDSLIRSLSRARFFIMAHILMKASATAEANSMRDELEALCDSVAEERAVPEQAWQPSAVRINVLNH